MLNCPKKDHVKFRGWEGQRRVSVVLSILIWSFMTLGEKRPPRPLSNCLGSGWTVFSNCRSTHPLVCFRFFFLLLLFLLETSAAGASTESWPKTRQNQGCQCNYFRWFRSSAQDFKCLGASRQAKVVLSAGQGADGGPLALGHSPGAGDAHGDRQEEGAVTGEWTSRGVWGGGLNPQMSQNQNPGK